MEDRATNLVDKERQETDYNVYFLTQMYLSTKLIPIILAPVVWGIRIQPTFALVRVVRGD